MSREQLYISIDLSIVFQRDINNGIHSNHKAAGSKLSEEKKKTETKTKNKNKQTKKPILLGLRKSEKNSLISFNDILRLFRIPTENRKEVKEPIGGEYFNNNYCYRVAIQHIEPSLQPHKF